MKWRHVIVGTVLVLGAGSAPVVPEERTWVSYEASVKQEDGTEKIVCYDIFRGKDTITKEIDCAEYKRRATVAGYPNPVKLKDPNLTSRASVIGIITPKADAAVTYDSMTSAGDVATGGVVSTSFSHTSPADSVLIVANILGDQLSDPDTIVNSCTYNGIDMFYGHMHLDSGNARVTIYYLPDAPSGSSYTVYCQWNDAPTTPPTDGGVVAVSMTGADLHMPKNVSNGSDGTDASAEVTITTTVANTLIADFMFTEEANTSDIIVGGDLHTEKDEIDLSGGANANTGIAGLVVAAGATTTSWSWTGNEEWGMAGIAIKPPCSDTVGARCTEVFYNTGTTTWTSPANLTSIDVACWGAGGAGDAHINVGNGGGGGGAFASTTGIAISGSTNYDVFVGTGGVAAAGTSGGNGGRSHFFDGTTYSPIACGGSGATSVTGAAGGTTACSVGGAEEYAGGAGGTGNDASDTGGGGGGSAGPGGTGDAGTTSGVSGGDGGPGDSGAVPGGTGAVVSVAGSDGPGGLTGGGGGGGGDNGSPLGGKGAHGGGGGGSETIGGDGGDGMCQISYIVPAPGGGGGVLQFIQDLIWFD